MLTKAAVVAAGAGLCFLGYCVYFDRKRRSDPLFKQKLREKRRKAKQQSGSKTGEIELPTSGNFEDIQNFFLQQVQIGEDLLAKGDIDAGVEHLCTAIAICGRPQQLLQVLKNSMPPQVFQLLLTRLPSVCQRVSQSVVPVIPVEEDVE